MYIISLDSYFMRSQIGTGVLPNTLGIAYSLLSVASARRKVHTILLNSLRSRLMIRFSRRDM